MAPVQPNIIFIMADDHASKAIGCYGANINSTPNLDRIANDGMRFDHCYVTNSICTPSRASILTGTYNHVNGVVTLDSKINKHLPNVAKHLRTGGYQTAMIGKWHLGEGTDHEPSGFDFWSVVPGQGDYFDPVMIEMGQRKVFPGYATDVITDQSIDWISNRQKDKPFFLMCHHKAPHRSWECDPKHRHLYQENVKVPETFDDDYKTRALAAAQAKMKVSTDLTYHDLGLVQPDGGSEVGELLVPNRPAFNQRKVPYLENVTQIRLIDKDSGEVFTFKSQDELQYFKYQRYMKRYLRTIASIDDNVGRMLNYIDSEGLAENTVIIYTSDQGFFLGDHGWFDKRFMYEESFQMPFMIRYPGMIKPGTVCKDIVCNVDFAATFLDLAGLPVPSYMQGRSFASLLQGTTPEDWSQVAYHRYWMHRDTIHDARAHYGVRNQQYKLIYWYNKGFGLPGCQDGGEETEWELFDCDKDSLELVNIANDGQYAEILSQMKAELDHKMVEIGDEPEHYLIPERM